MLTLYGPRTVRLDTVDTAKTELIWYSGGSCLNVVDATKVPAALNVADVK